MALTLEYPDTLSGKKARARDVLARGIFSNFSAQKAHYNYLQSIIWDNPNGLTPQQVMDALGTDAGQVLTIAAAARTFINSLSANAVVGPPLEYTINVDGTVTISA